MARIDFELNEQTYVVYVKDLTLADLKAVEGLDGAALAEYVVQSVNGVTALDSVPLRILNNAVAAAVQETNVPLEPTRGYDGVKGAESLL